MTEYQDALFTDIIYRLDYPEDSLERTRKRIYWFSALSLVGVFLLPIVGEILLPSNVFKAYWINSFAHSLVESYCGIISLIIAYVVYREYRSSGKRSNLYLFLGFASMGVYDFFHAHTNDNVTLFVWFHSLSAFSGGAFILWSALSFKHKREDARWLQRVFVASGIIAIVGSAAAVNYLGPNLIGAVTSDIIRNSPVDLPFISDFAIPIMTINILATVCFLFAGIVYLRYFQNTNDILYHVLALSSFLFFESEFLFSFSKLWDLTWWYWHGIKLIIYIGMIIGFAHGFTKNFRDLRASRKKLNGTVEELKHAYDHLKNTQEELLEAEKLASIGKMAATISHEIRNPLGAIKNSVGIFKHHARLSGEDNELLDIIGNEINRLDVIISDFLNFAKPHPLNKTRTNLNEFIDEVLSLLSHSGKAVQTIYFRKKFDRTIPDLFIDRHAMKQVLWNIFINSVQAMPDGGTLTIETRRKIDAIERSLNSTITIIITDTGQGMQPETLANAFQPFFSTKTKGTGLGLSIVERTVKLHHGTITLSSNVGEGTQVNIDMPIGAAEPFLSKEHDHVVHTHC